LEQTYLLATLPLYVAPLSLLIAALVIVLLPAKPERPLAPLVAWVAVGFAALVLLTSAPAVFRGSVVLDQVVRMFRSGSLDLLLGCVLDKVSLASALVVLVCLAGFVAAAAKRKLPPRLFAVALLIGAGASCAAMAEGFPTLLFGLSLVFWASHLAREGNAFVRLTTYAFATGMACALLAVGFAFWSLGGQWLDASRYFADFKPRFAAEGELLDQAQRARPSASLFGQGKLTILSHPGSRVYLGVADEGQLKRSEPIGVTPMLQQSVPAGLQKIAIEPGGSAIVGGEGIEVALVDTVLIREGVETRITLVGPTVSFVELGPMLRDGALAKRRVGGATIGGIVGALLSFSLCWFAVACAGRARGLFGSFGRACFLIGFAAFVARLGPLSSFSPMFALIAMLLLTFVAALAAYRDLGPWLPAAALVGSAGLAGAPLAALAIAGALAPALLALAALGEARQRALVEVAAPVVATTKKKKRKSEKAAVDEELPPTTLPGRNPIAVALAFGLAPLPFLGPFAGIGSAIVTPFSASPSLGVAFWLTIAICWGALAWSVQRELTGAAAAPGNEQTRVAVLLSAVACALGPLVALGLQPWTLSARLGPVLAVVIATSACVLPLLAVGLAKRRPAALRDASDVVPARVSTRVERLLDSVDLVLGFPLALLSLPLGRRSPAEKGEHS